MYTFWSTLFILKCTTFLKYTTFLKFITIKYKVLLCPLNKAKMLVSFLLKTANNISDYDEAVSFKALSS